MHVLGFTLLLAAGSFAAGLLGALTGLGGGVVIVPILTLDQKVDIRYAIGASLVSVIATSSGAAAAYVREGFSNIRIGMILEIVLLSTPAILPDRLPDAFGVDGDPACDSPEAERSLFDPLCPLAIPRTTGMSILLTSPAYLLALAALFRRRSRLVAGSALAVLAIAFVNLMHFSQGWVNFGYRFSNDFVVFALPLVAVGMGRRGRVGWLAAGLVALSVAINLWGVIWGNVLGW